MPHPVCYPLLLLWSTVGVLLLLNDNLQLAYFSSVLIPVHLPPAVDGHQSLAVRDLTIACDDAILWPQAVHVHDGPCLLLVSKIHLLLVVGRPTTMDFEGNTGCSQASTNSQVFMCGLSMVKKGTGHKCDQKHFRGSWLILRLLDGDFSAHHSSLFMYVK